MANIVRCGDGIATKRQATLIRRLDEELAFTYKGKTVKEASDYIKSSLYVLGLEREHIYEDEAYWGDQ